ncbi:DNA-binding REB1-like [Olea europaea subsp. europaea]|uniref:DNA-binding REB1-like n=1 Tax=Olea europaea subsp. europaea TaxID=158383 RepID=A0A8S0V900_OLEEU|nr:DNA-binding REB1-like [Olea europaea subsp. europaea]
MRGGKEIEKEIKSKTIGKDHKDGYTENKGRKEDRKEIGTCSEIHEVNALEKQDILTEETVDAEGNAVEKKKKENPTEDLSDIEQEGNVHIMDKTRDNELENGNKGKKKKPKLVENGLDSTKANKSNKKETMRKIIWDEIRGSHVKKMRLWKQLSLSRVSAEKRSKHGMLRDNICWMEISDKLSTRNQANCCMKWYNQLTSPILAEGMWADFDDYRLFGVLFNLDSTYIEDVDWDNMLDDRSGDLCRKRWNQMVLHIGKHGTKSFAEQVEVLAQHYCPHRSKRGPG